MKGISRIVYGYYLAEIVDLEYYKDVFLIDDYMYVIHDNGSERMHIHIFEIPSSWNDIGYAEGRNYRVVDSQDWLAYLCRPGDEVGFSENAPISLSMVQHEGNEKWYWKGGGIAGGPPFSANRQAPKV